MPITASQIKPASIAEINTLYFAKKPSIGGMPARETINIVSAAAIRGFLSQRPEICSNVSHSLPFFER